MEEMKIGAFEEVIAVERRELKVICEESIKAMEDIMEATTRLHILSQEMEMYESDELIAEPKFGEVITKTLQMVELQEKFKGKLA